MDLIDKKRLWVYIAIAYGVTLVMAVFMYIGYSSQMDLTAFVNTQMMYPACGVILGKLLAKKEDDKLPMGGYITILVTTGIMMLISLVSVFVPHDPVNVLGQNIGFWNLMTQYPIMIGSIVLLVLFWTCGKEKRAKNGLALCNIKSGIVLILVFVALLVGRIFIGVFIEDLISGTHNSLDQLLSKFTNIGLLINLAFLPFNFFFVFIAFFGEEYGWRYFLQPVMQNKFGKRLGVILLGLVWAVWHLDADFMYYTVKDGPQMFAVQIVTCVAMAIFFGYAYMKTGNIWVPVVMHYLNNNIIPLVSGQGSSVTEQSISWSHVPVAAVSFIVFILFIFMPVFNSKSAKANK